MKTVHRLAPIVKNAVSADGVNIGINNGRAAGQLVFHSHVHIIPRFTGDGFLHWHGAPLTTQEITGVAHQIQHLIKKTGR
jgi:histidine triad (HIT) family protein